MLYNKNKIALVDCNSFYVSCERLFKPSINKKPVVVLSSNDGCIISRSIEAKKLGIKMGEPYFKVKKIVKENNVKTFLKEKNQSFLTSGSKEITDKINLTENPEIVIWGIVTHVIHAL